MSRIVRGVLILIALLFHCQAVFGATFALGTSNIFLGPASGSNSVVLAATPSTLSWTATNGANWLHLSAANQSGTGSTNVVFSYDTNAGPTRSGTLTIGGLTCTVTQAGSSYVDAGVLTTLTSSAVGPLGIAVTPSGYVYFSSGYDPLGSIGQLSPEGGLVFAVTYGVSHPRGLWADASGNIYIANTDGEDILEFEGGTYLTGLVSLETFGDPYGVAGDSSGNLYIADGYIVKWTGGTNFPSILVSSGVTFAEGVAVDVAGNVYIADTFGDAAILWTAANGTLTTLASVAAPEGIAVDGSGNVFIANTGQASIREWSAASRQSTLLISTGLSSPCATAVDTLGNLYIVDNGDSKILELPNVFVDSTAHIETAASGTDYLSPIIPADENLSGPFTPTSTATWLTITGVTNGVVSFSFAANTNVAARTAHIKLFGENIPIKQNVALPTVVAGPIGTTFGSGTNGVLNVSASSVASLFYQWQFNGSNIMGATSSNLDFGPLQLNNAGLYDVIVSNTGGAVTSAVAVVNISPQLSVQMTNGAIWLSWPGPFVLQGAGQVNGPFNDIAAATSPYRDGTTNQQRFYRLRSNPFNLAATNLQIGGFGISVPGIPGCNFILQSSTNLLSWLPLQTNPSPFMLVDTNAANHPEQFYRAVLAH